jgi:hypothetical protein
MANNILSKIDTLLEKYKTDHHGEDPLYILVSADEEPVLREAVRKSDGLNPDDIVTTYRESKILRHDMLQKGDVVLTNDLPETGS